MKSWEKVVLVLTVLYVLALCARLIHDTGVLHLPQAPPHAHQASGSRAGPVGTATEHGPGKRGGSPGSIPGVGTREKDTAEWVSLFDWGTTFPAGRRLTNRGNRAHHGGSW
jgi:hypothetical protein